MSDNERVPTRVKLVAFVVCLSGGYHLADGVALVANGVGDSTLNILFAGLSISLGLGLVLSAAALFLVGSGGWFTGAAMVLLCTALVDVTSVLLRGSVVSALDAVVLLACLVVVVRMESADRQRADMDEEESVHSLLDYP